MTGSTLRQIGYDDPPTVLRSFNRDDVVVIKEFVRRVNVRAGRTIERTGMVSGAHWNAMIEELKLLEEQ